jgi:hypothetical protein
MFICVLRRRGQALLLLLLLAAAAALGPPPKNKCQRWSIWSGKDSVKLYLLLTLCKQIKKLLVVLVVTETESFSS